MLDILVGGTLYLLEQLNLKYIKILDILDFLDSN